MTQTVNMKFRGDKQVYFTKSNAYQDYNPQFTTTTFFDVDGTLSYHNLNMINVEVVDYLKWLTSQGHQIVLTSARCKEWLKEVETMLESLGVRVLSIVPKCGRGTRILINDKGDNKQTPSALAIDIPSDSMNWFETHKKIIKESMEVYGE